MQDNTKSKIIEVASNLFLTKGYEETRISDIIKGLDGLTKGAVYHHFDSKEDIFNAVVKEIGSKNIQILDEIKNDHRLNGAEKLSKMVNLGFHNKNMEIRTLIKMREKCKSEQTWNECTQNYIINFNELQ